MTVAWCTQEKQSAEQKETALVRTPSLLEICGHSYYFGGFLVGPQVAHVLCVCYTSYPYV